MQLTSAQIRLFRKKVLSYYKKHGRNLPWRKTRNPYHTFVSEIMLQQTQVDRVIPKYLAFIKQFPSFEILAEAALADVLKLWIGLGYNRRAKFLKQSAEIIVRSHRGKLPTDAALLQKLPGIGPATAASLVAFAHNRPTVFLETNVRTVLIHEFFQDHEKISDQKLYPLAAAVLDKKNPARWYNAIMDYGTLLKQTENHTRKSTQYTRQSKFKGSVRETRGKIIRALTEKPLSRKELTGLIADERLPKIIADLQAEGLIARRQGKFSLG